MVQDEFTIGDEFNIEVKVAIEDKFMTEDKVTIEEFFGSKDIVHALSVFVIPFTSNPTS